MNISGTPVSGSLVGINPFQGVQANSGNGDSDSGGVGGAAHAHHGHRGGGMSQAVQQALQSLGLTVPQTGGASSSQSSTSSSGGADSDGDNDGTAATSGVKSDLRNFVHALFQAIKNEPANPDNASSATPAASNATASSGPGGKFSNGLSALISQVSGGSAPLELQTAFDKLVSDLQSSASSSTSTSTTGSATAVQANLVQMLTALQQNLGYGASTNSAASVGNVVSTSA